MKHYFGVRLPSRSAIVKVADVDGHTNLDPRYDLWNHSPAGFEWGYQGSGPAQLALALLCDALADDALAVQLYQRFKRRVIATISEDCWGMTREFIWGTCLAICSDLFENRDVIDLEAGLEVLCDQVDS